jgi:HK97 gp10 family phage protein
LTFDIRIDVGGAKNKINIIRKNIPRAEAASAEAIVDHVWPTAQRLVPVDTGFLWSSIKGKTSGGSFEVKASARYASFVEFGTSKMAAQPFMTPAVESIPWSQIVKIAKSILAGG